VKGRRPVSRLFEKKEKTENLSLYQTETKS
jgi:hypothetical protein